MAEVDLDLFKKIVKVDFEEEDEVLQLRLDGAEEAVIRATHRSREELCELNGGTFPRTLVNAICILAARMYSEPEGVSAVQMHEMPGLQALIKPWRKFITYDGG